MAGSWGARSGGRDAGWVLGQNLSPAPISLPSGRFLNLQDRSILGIRHQCSSWPSKLIAETFPSPPPSFLSTRSLPTAAYGNSLQDAGSSFLHNERCLLQALCGPWWWWQTAVRNLFPLKDWHLRQCTRVLISHMTWLHLSVSHHFVMTVIDLKRSEQKWQGSIYTNRRKQFRVGPASAIYYFECSLPTSELWGLLLFTAALKALQKKNNSDLSGKVLS